MRLALLTTAFTVAGLAACAPLPPPGPYGYAPSPAPVANYGYYNEGYAPGGYYPEPGYAPYATPYAPGPTIIVGGERRFDNDRYRYERQRAEGGYRDRPNQGREYRPQPGPQGREGGRPGPSPAAMGRPGPGPAPQAPRPLPGPGPGPSPGPGGHAPDFNPANPTAQGGADR